MEMNILWKKISMSKQVHESKFEHIGTSINITCYIFAVFYLKYLIKVTSFYSLPYFVHTIYIILTNSI